MRVLHFDCFSGISGDMTLAALFDAGVDPEAVRRVLDSFGLPITMEVERVKRNGIAANYVNIVAPGLVKTEMGRRLMNAYGQDIEAMDPSAPYGRVCRPEDVAAVVRWIVSDGAGYVNGERIYVDAGAQ